MSRAQNGCRKVSAVIFACLLLASTSSFAGENKSPSEVKPEIEAVSDTDAFIRWTVPNPGGTILHFAVVEYGKDPNRLNSSAKSPTRINAGNPQMVFRARVRDLQPGSTYYFRAYSTQANGVPDSEPTVIGRFTTRKY